MATERQDHLEENDLKNVDLSGIKIVKTEIHPNAAQLFEDAQQKVTEALGDEFKLSKDLALFNFYACPLLQNFKMTSLFITYSYMGFFIDDHFEKFPNDIPYWITSFKAKHFPGKGVMEKWWRFFLKVAKESMDEFELEGVIETTIVWWSGIAEARRIRNIQTDKEYLDLRCIEAAGPLQLYWIAMDAGVRLTDDLKNNPNYIGLNKQASMYLVITNDLFSLKKEVRQGDYKFNYVYVKMKNGNLTAQESVNRIIIEMEEYKRMALVHGELLKKTNDPKLSRYVDGMFALMDGNNYFSSICKRYNQL